MKRFVCIFMILMLAFNFTGCSQIKNDLPITKKEANIPEGVREEFYNDMLFIWEGLQKEFETEKLKESEEYYSIIKKYNDKILREKEREIIDILYELIADTRMYWYFFIAANDTYLDSAKETVEKDIKIFTELMELEY